MKKLFYFGCKDSAGHYLWEGPNEIYPQTISHRIGANNANTRFFERMDAVYAPGRTEKEGVYQEVDIDGFKILAWWDRTVDKRPGSNSALIGWGFNTSEEMIEAAKIIYPWVMSRQKIQSL